MLANSHFILIVLLQKCACFYSRSPANVPHPQGSAGFRSLVAIFYDLVHPTFANLCQSCHIPVLLSISFSVFLFLSYQLLSVVPLVDLFLHPFSLHASTIAILLSKHSSKSFYTRHLTHLHIVYFILHGFSTYHLQYSHLSSSILFVNQKQLRYSRVSNSQKWSP